MLFETKQASGPERHARLAPTGSFAGQAAVEKLRLQEGGEEAIEDATVAWVAKGRPWVGNGWGAGLGWGYKGPRE